MNSILKLLYSIGGDINPLKRELARVPQDAKDVGKKAGVELNKGIVEGQKSGGAKPGDSGVAKELGGQLKGLVMSYVGIGAVVGKVMQQAQRAQDISSKASQMDLGVEAWQELQAAAEKSGMAIEEVQRMARELPDDFAAMMEPIRESGGIMKSEDVESLTEVKKAIDEASNSAGKLFANLWSGGKALANLVANGAFAGAGGAASKLGEMFGSERMQNAGRFLTTTAEIGAEQLVAGKQPSSVERTAVERFSRKAKEKAEFDAWWESVGGPEASKLGGPVTRPRRIGENVFTNSQLLTPSTMHSPRGLWGVDSKAEAEMRRLRKAVEERL